MAAPSFPVEESPMAYLQNTPTVNAAPIARIVIDGAASAGSKHIIDASAASDVLTEAVRVYCPVDTTSVSVMSIVGVAAHPFAVRLTFSASDTVSGGQKLKDGYPDIRTVMPNERRKLKTNGLSSAGFYVDIVAVPVTGATKGSVKGDFVLELN